MLRKHGAWTRSSSMILRRKKSTDTTSLMLILLVIFCTFYIYRGSFIPESPIILEQRFSTEISNILILTEEECSALWPGLSKEVNNAVSQGPFELRRKADDYPGLVQGRIKNGKLYVISANFDNILHHVGATLHALHRAIITSSTKIPDTVFALNIDDVPQVNTWSFSRSDDAFTPTTPWLMPHFSSWSWPKPYIGPFDQALSSIELLEQAIPWESKIDKAVWRGTAWFNPQWSIGLRPKLINVTEEKDWADVEYSGDNNMIKIEDFCKYKYILYAEGTSYSGRLPFHQACASIILTPPPTFLMHNTHLMRPIFSSLLPLSGGSDSTQEKTKFPPPDSYPLPETAKAWPFSYPTALANVVFVRPDWSDLEATIKYLERNPEIAKGIAQRQRDLFVQGGYLSEAAEACYWRSLVKGWSEVVRFDENEWEEGIRFETYALLGKTKYA